MGRAGFVVQRLLLLIPVAVGVTIIVFFMVHLIPGDPAATILGRRLSAASVRDRCSPRTQPCTPS